MCSESFTVAIATACSPSNPFSADGPQSPSKVKSPNLLENGNCCTLVTTSSYPIPCAIARATVSTLAWFENVFSNIPEVLLTPSIVWKGRRGFFAQSARSQKLLPDDGSNDTIPPVNASTQSFSALSALWRLMGDRTRTPCSFHVGRLSRPVNTRAVEMAA